MHCMPGIELYCHSQHICAAELSCGRSHIPKCAHTPPTQPASLPVHGRGQCGRRVTCMHAVAPCMQRLLVAAACQPVPSRCASRPATRRRPVLCASIISCDAVLPSPPHSRSWPAPKPDWPRGGRPRVVHGVSSRQAAGGGCAGAGGRFGRGYPPPVLQRAAPRPVREGALGPLQRAGARGVRRRVPGHGGGEGPKGRDADRYQPAAGMHA